MGDFYELFMEDAYIGAKVLNITLTENQMGKMTESHGRVFRIMP
jgi:DNA mismatch repair ATPase MutS